MKQKTQTSNSRCPRFETQADDKLKAAVKLSKGFVKKYEADF
ncbi:hypothetical protein [Phormidesmis priestleyi]|nr:hypothetical protein [Phormidesmis priestleyi]